MHKADLDPCADPDARTRRAPKAAPDAAAESAARHAARAGLPAVKVAAPAGDRAAAAGSAADRAGTDWSPVEVDARVAVLRQRGSPLLDDYAALKVHVMQARMDHSLPSTEERPRSHRL